MQENKEKLEHAAGETFKKIQISGSPIRTQKLELVWKCLIHLTLNLVNCEFLHTVLRIFIGTVYCKCNGSKYNVFDIFSLNFFVFL